MKKYLQITIVLGFFGLLVLIRQSQFQNATTTNRLPGLPDTSSVSPAQETPTTGSSAGQYKDGTYKGSVEDAQYGLLQVSAVISNGKLSDVLFLQYPSDNRTSISINSQALPLLRQEAIQAQSAQVDIISGASDSSPAFSRSLVTALQAARQ